MDAASTVETQERWVTSRLASSRTTWNVLANGVAFTAVTPDRTDQWDGYPAARQRLLDAMGRAGNGVMLSGDIHKHLASDLRADFGRPDSPNVGVELICSSIASDGDGAELAGPYRDWLQHPWMKFYEGRRGYVHTTFTTQRLTATFWGVDWVQRDDTAPKVLRARFTSPAGRPGLTRQN